MNDFKSQFAQGYEAGMIDEYHKNADELARLKAENNRLTAELEHVYELYNSMLTEKKPPRLVCPFGDHQETCAEFRANGCDLCKLEQNGAEK